MTPLHALALHLADESVDPATALRDALRELAPRARLHLVPEDAPDVGGLRLPWVDGVAAVVVGARGRRAVRAAEAVAVAALAQRGRQRAEVAEGRAGTDHLTGLPNRRRGEEVLEQAAARAARAGRPFGVAFLDVDRFKAVNDRLGHDVGDRALQHVAMRLRTAARAGETVVRWGGEELLVVVEGGRADLAAERLRRAAAGPVPGTAAVLTLSAGAATSEPGLGTAEVVRLAEGRMRDAKRRGRDRCVHEAEAVPARRGRALAG